MSAFAFLGDDVVKYGIFSLFHSYELKKLLIISKYFKKILQTLSDWNNINDVNYWNCNLLRYYGNYGVWRRGWIDLSKGIFERLSNDDMNQLKYFMLRYKNDEASTIPTDINSLYLYNYCSKPLEVDHKISFVSNIIEYDLCRTNFNCIREIYLMNSNLRDHHILLIANALISRQKQSNLEVLILYNNEFITELYMSLLFRSIGENAPCFRSLDVSQTRCGDAVCDIIYDFYTKYNKTMLSHINLENVLHIISENGVKKLENILSDNLISKKIKSDFMIRTKLKTITSW